MTSVHRTVTLDRNLRQHKHHPRTVRGLRSHQIHRLAHHASGPGRIARRQQRRTQTPAPDGQIAFGDYSFVLAREELRRGEEFVRLTAAEASLLKTLARQPGVPVSRETLSAENPMIGNTRAIDVQVTRLRRKIEENPRFPRHLQAVRGVGYVLIAD